MIYFLTDDFPQKPYYDVEHKIKSCHWGQRKLLFSEIQFLTQVSKHISLDDSMLLYVGAADGYHIPFLYSLFPSVTYLLYDPRKFAIKEKSKLHIVTNSKGYFSTNSYKDVFEFKNKHKKKYLLFISDIRTERKENLIWKEMLQQQQWGVELMADFMLLKFRFPYFIEGNTIETYNDITQKYFVKHDNMILSTNTKPKGDFILPYLDGTVYFQTRAKNTSTETRLFVTKRRFNENFKHNNPNSYNFKYWDVNKYEEQMFYFNTVYRISEHKYKKSYILSQHLLGYDKTFDSVLEYIIMNDYLLYYKKTYITLKVFLNYMSWIDRYLFKSNGKSLLDCVKNYKIHDKYKKVVESSQTSDNTKLFIKKIYEKHHSHY